MPSKILYLATLRCVAQVIYRMCNYGDRNAGEMWLRIKRFASITDRTAISVWMQHEINPHDLKTFEQIKVNCNTLRDNYMGKMQCQKVSQTSQCNFSFYLIDCFARHVWYRTHTRAPGNMVTYCRSDTTDCLYKYMGWYLIADFTVILQLFAFSFSRWIGSSVPAIYIHVLLAHVDSTHCRSASHQSWPAENICDSLSIEVSSSWLSAIRKEEQ